MTSAHRISLNPSWPRYFKLVANRAGGCHLDLAMPWHGSTAAVRWIAINGVAPAFAIEDASVSLEMANELAALH
jgi:hypothetical protein